MTVVIRIDGTSLVLLSAIQQGGHVENIPEKNTVKGETDDI
jgi:hypothetical protein